MRRLKSDRAVTRQQERRKALTAAALQLFLAHGIDGVSIEDITEATGVAKGTFYLYFDDKRAIVDAILAPVRDEVLGAFAASAQALEKAENDAAVFEAYKVVGNALVAAMLAHHGAIRLYLQENRVASGGARAPVAQIAARIREHALHLTKIAHERGLLKPMHPTVTTMAVVGAAEQLMLAVLREEDVGDLLAVPDALTTMVLDGLRLSRGEAR